MTLEEFRALPEGPPYYEFEEGELIPMTSPTPEHQDILAELVHALRQCDGGSVKERNPVLNA